MEASWRSRGSTHYELSLDNPTEPLKTKQFEKAESYYTEAIKINPTRFGPIYKNRGIARLELNKNKEAKQDFENYLKHTPNAKDKTQIIQAIKEI
jgi:tetratricopeptide (TPR) repeat protein